MLQQQSTPDYSADIAAALATQGGHLSIGRGGFTLHLTLVAVGREPDPAPWHGLSYAPLHVVASRYAAAGAELWNIPEVETMPTPANRRTAP